MDAPFVTNDIVCYLLKKKLEKGHQSTKYILTCTLTIRSPYDNVKYDLDKSDSH